MAMFSTSDKWSGRYLQRTLSDSSNKELASVFGSVLGKSSNDWRCKNCSDAFIQEQMIYPDPHSKNIFYCRPCFEVLYSQGPCHKCTKPVISDAPFVKHNNTVWHNACYVCVRCGFDDPSEIVLDPDENSLCEGCFMTGVPSVPAQPKASPQARVAQELIKKLPSTPLSERGNERRKLPQPPVTGPELSRRNATVDHRSPETIHQLSQYTYLRENHRPIHSDSGGKSPAPTKCAPMPKSSGSSISELRMLFSKENVDPSQKSDASLKSSKNFNSVSSKWDQPKTRGVTGWESPVSQTAASKWNHMSRYPTRWESATARYDQPKASKENISSVSKPRHWATSLDKPVVDTQSNRLNECNAQTSNSWSNESKPLGNKIITKKWERNHETHTLCGPDGAKPSSDKRTSPNQTVTRCWESQTKSNVPEKKWEHSVEIKTSPVASVLSRWGKPEGSESSASVPEPVKKTFSYVSVPSIAPTGKSGHTHSPIGSKAASPNLSTASSLSSSVFVKRKEKFMQEPLLATKSSDSSPTLATTASFLPCSTQFNSPSSSASLTKPVHTPKSFMEKSEASSGVSSKSASTPKPSVLSFISKYESMSPSDPVPKRSAPPHSSASKRTHVFSPCASLDTPTSVQFNREKDIHNKVHEYTGKYAISPLNRLSQPRKLSDASERFKKATTAEKLKGLSPSVSLGRPVTAEHKPVPSPQVHLDHSNSQTAHVKAFATPSIASRINHLSAKVEESSAVKSSAPRIGSGLSSRIQALKQHVGEGMSDVVQKSSVDSTSCTSFSDPSDYFTNTHPTPGTPRHALASTPHSSIVSFNDSSKNLPMVSASSPIPSHFMNTPSTSTPLNTLSLTAPVNRSSWRQPPKRFDETLMCRTDTSGRVNEEIKRQQGSTKASILSTTLSPATPRTPEPPLSLPDQPRCSHSPSTNRIYQDLFNEKKVKHMFCGGSSLDRYDIATPSSTLHSSNSNKTLSTSPSVVFSTRSTPIKHLGGMIKCQGCNENATQNEVVAGPLGKRYHAKCLKCGLCSKSVDSGCRVNAKGQLRCENCRAKDTPFRRRSSAVRVMC